MLQLPQTYRLAAQEVDENPEAFRGNSPLPKYLQVVARHLGTIYKNSGVLASVLEKSSTNTAAQLHDRLAVAFAPQLANRSALTNRDHEVALNQIHLSNKKDRNVESAQITLKAFIGLTADSLCTVSNGPNHEHPLNAVALLTPINTGNLKILRHLQEIHHAVLAISGMLTKLERGLLLQNNLPTSITAIQNIRACFEKVADECRLADFPSLAKRTNSEAVSNAREPADISIIKTIAAELTPGC